MLTCSMSCMQHNDSYFITMAHVVYVEFSSNSRIGLLEIINIGDSPGAISTKRRRLCLHTQGPIHHWQGHILLTSNCVFNPVHAGNVVNILEGGTISKSFVLDSYAMSPEVK